MPNIHMVSSMQRQCAFDQSARTEVNRVGLGSENKVRESEATEKGARLRPWAVVSYAVEILAQTRGRMVDRENVTDFEPPDSPRVPQQHDSKQIFN